MKLIFLLLKISLLITLMTVISFNTQCKDPEDFEPEFDSLMAPPAAPELIEPPCDTIFIFDQWHPPPQDIKLMWHAVEGSHRYEISISGKTQPFQTIDTTFIMKAGQGRYEWKVRSYNSSWTWYTDWSDIWNFRVVYVDEPQ